MNKRQGLYADMRTVPFPYMVFSSVLLKTEMFEIRTERSVFVC